MGGKGGLCGAFCDDSPFAYIFFCLPVLGVFLLLLLRCPLLHWTRVSIPFAGVHLDDSEHNDIVLNAFVHHELATECITYKKWHALAFSFVRVRRLSWEQVFLGGELEIQ